MGVSLRPLPDGAFAVCLGDAVCKDGIVANVLLLEWVPICEAVVLMNMPPGYGIVPLTIRPQGDTLGSRIIKICDDRARHYELAHAGFFSLAQDVEGSFDGTL